MAQAVPNFGESFEDKSTCSSVSMDEVSNSVNTNTPSSSGGTASRSQFSSTSSYSSACNEGEGEILWKDFVFKPAQAEDYAKVLGHMRESFYRDEPLNAITGYSEEKAQDMDLMVSQYFKDGYSTIVLEKETGKVAGARIIAIHRRAEKHSPLPLKSSEMLRIMPFLDKVDEAADIFSHYPHIDEYAELFMASVHPEFRGQGLAGEMYKGAIRLLQAKGFKVMKSCFTSPFTRRIGEKMGFRELATAKFNEHRNAEGTLVFPDAGEDEMAVIGVLEI